MVDDADVMNRQEAGLRRFARELEFEGELELLREALTHSSYANEVGASTAHNERLEFLGDAVLGLLVSQGLFTAHRGVPEGMLSRWRAAIVNERSLADHATQVGLGELLWLGKGEDRTGGRTRPSVLANALEAVLGALFIAGGLPAAARLVEQCFGDRIRQGSPDAYRDWKTRLQEAAQRLVGQQPEYVELAVHGPDHARTFDTAVLILGEEYGRGTGPSKKVSQRHAAEQALTRLEREAEGGRFQPTEKPPGT